MSGKDGLSVAQMELNEKRKDCFGRDLIHRCCGVLDESIRHCCDCDFYKSSEQWNTELYRNHGTTNLKRILDEYKVRHGED